MNVLITGGTGFIGRRLVMALLERGTLPDAAGAEQPIARIRVSDIGPGVQPLPADERIETVLGDFSQPGAVAGLLDEATGAVFHLAAVVSGQAEAEFELGLRVNLAGTLELLAAARTLAISPF